MLQSIDILGKSINLYDILNNIGVLCMCLFLVLQKDKLKSISLISTYKQYLKKTFFSRHYLLIMIFVLMLLFLGLLLILNPAFGKWFTDGNANYYGTLLAWVLSTSVCSVVFCCPFNHFFDIVSTGLPLFLSISKLACFFQGCCYGFAANTFYFNLKTNRREFPVQLVESGIALLLFVLLLLYTKKRKHPGTVFPLYLVLYSFSRLLTEFLRDDLPCVWGKLDAYQIISIVSFAIGLVALVVVIRIGSKIDAFTYARYKTFLDQKVKRINKKRRIYHKKKKR